MVLIAQSDDHACVTLYGSGSLGQKEESYTTKSELPTEGVNRLIFVNLTSREIGVNSLAIRSAVYDNAVTGLTHKIGAGGETTIRPSSTFSSWINRFDSRGDILGELKNLPNGILKQNDRVVFLMEFPHTLEISEVKTYVEKYPNERFPLPDDVSADTILLMDNVPRLMFLESGESTYDIATKESVFKDTSFFTRESCPLHNTEITEFLAVLYGATISSKKRQKICRTVQCKIPVGLELMEETTRLCAWSPNVATIDIGLISNSIEFVTSESWEVTLVVKKMEKQDWKMHGTKHSKEWLDGILENLKKDKEVDFGVAHKLKRMGDTMQPIFAQYSTTERLWEKCNIRFQNLWSPPNTRSAYNQVQIPQHARLMSSAPCKSSSPITFIKNEEVVDE